MSRWLLALWLFAAIVFPLFAYIDPATGSMLFSLLTGVAVTFFFFIKNVFLKVKYSFPFEIGIRKLSAFKRPLFVIYSEGKQYWNVFEPIIREFNVRGVPCVYYSSDEDDPGLLESPAFIGSRFIGKGNRAYRFLNFLEADVCLMTTPGLDVLQVKRSPGVSHYAHILHAVTDATLYRLFGLDYFDSVFLTGPYQEKDIRYLEQLRGTPPKRLVVVGCTYLDVLTDKAKSLQVSPDGNTVLVAPSWGENGILRRFGMRLLRPLLESEYRVIVRPHPQSMISEKSVIEQLQNELRGFSNIEWNFDRENLDAMARSDVLISDFSGIIFDYVFLFKRPVLYPKFEFDLRPYDAGDVPTEPWTFRTLREIGHGFDEEDFPLIREIIMKGIRMNGKRAKRIEQVKKEAYLDPGSAGRRVVEELLKIGEEIQVAKKAAGIGRKK